MGTVADLERIRRARKVIGRDCAKRHGARPVRSVQKLISAEQAAIYRAQWARATA